MKLKKIKINQLLWNQSIECSNNTHKNLEIKQKIMKKKILKINGME